MIPIGKHDFNFSSFEAGIMNACTLLCSLLSQEVRIQEFLPNTCPSIIGIRVIDLLHLFC